MAWKIDVPCPDAVLYINLADALERGDWAAGLAQMRLNIFPIALACLHRLGLSWELAGELWNVAMASLVAIPLASLVERMFDRRAAIIAVLLYALHPGLIERSPELIRDPTFWFALTLALDVTWRAVTQVSPLWFGISGVAIGVAALSRFEGLFLFMPLIAWSAIRYWALTTGRRRLLAGVALAIGGLPALVLLAQQIWMPETNPLTLVRLEPLARILYCFAPHPPTPEQAASKENPGDLAAAIQLTPTYLKAFNRGMEPVALAMAVSGLIGWFSAWRRLEFWPLHLLALLFLAGSWFHLWYSHAISSRYILPVFIISVPWAALGLSWPAAKLASLPRGFQTITGRAWATGGILCFFACYGWADALSTNLEGRRELARLVRAIEADYGQDTAVFTSGEAAVLLGYYTDLDCVNLDGDVKFDVAADEIAKERTIVALLDRRNARFKQSATIARERLGFAQTHPSPDSKTRGPWVMFVESNAPAHRTAQAP